MNKWKRIHVHVGKRQLKKIGINDSHKASVNSVGKEAYNHDNYHEIPPYSSSHVQGLIFCVPPRLLSREMQPRVGGARISIMYSEYIFLNHWQEDLGYKPTLAYLYTCIRYCCDKEPKHNVWLKLTLC